ncbi:hypothetical protein [Erwinia sp.]|uniref:hypothetical protein n=1 Tax=Erwinia citreus TaxID=558 RepID=UPI003C795F39
MKIRLIPTLLLMMTSATPAYSAVTVKTSIDVLAEISTAVHIYVDGKDVTDSAFSLKLEDQEGYMKGVTPIFHFIGNASSVSLSLNTPANSELISDNSDRMKLYTYWLRVDGGAASADYSLNNQQVYATLADVPDQQKGIKVGFRSTQRSETYPLGSYRGTFDVIVSPSV